MKGWARSHGDTRTEVNKFLLNIPNLGEGMTLKMYTYACACNAHPLGKHKVPRHHPPSKCPAWSSLCHFHAFHDSLPGALLSVAVPGAPPLAIFSSSSICSQGARAQGHHPQQFVLDRLIHLSHSHSFSDHRFGRAAASGTSPPVVPQPFRLNPLNTHLILLDFAPQ